MEEGGRREDRAAMGRTKEAKNEWMLKTVQEGWEQGRGGGGEVYIERMGKMNENDSMEKNDEKRQKQAGELTVNEETNG